MYAPFWFFLFLLFFHPAYLIETTVPCPESISTPCSCFENDDGNQRMLCNKASLEAVKTAILDNNLQNIVWKLELYDTGDSILPKDYIKNFTALTYLGIGYSDLSYIEFGAFNGGSNLETLDIESNNIMWLSGGMFNGLSTKLQILKLSSNAIEYVYSDMEDVFLKVSDQIKLQGNEIKCTCQIQWLAELLQSDKKRPKFNGAICEDTNGVTYSLSATTEQFTDCPDVCSEGFHNCGPNETCITDSKTQSFSCSDGEFTSSLSSIPLEVFTSSAFYSSSLIEMASSMFLYSSVIIPTPNLLIDESTVIVETSSSLFFSALPTPKPSYSTLEQSTVHSETSQSKKGTEQPKVSSLTVGQVNSTVYEAYVTPSPTTLIGVPVEMCGSEICKPALSCVSYCECPTCVCQEGLAWTGNNSNPCVTFTAGLATCMDDGLIGISWPTVLPGSTITLPCCSTGDECTAKASRTCSLMGEWSNFSGENCVSTSVYKLQAVYYNALEGDSEALQLLSSGLYEQSMSLQLLSMDIGFLSQMITQTVDLVNDLTDPKVVEDIIGSVSNLLSDSQLDGWKGVEMPSAIIYQLFQTVEKLGSILPLENGTATIITNNLVLQVIVPDGSEKGWTISSSLINSTSLEGQSSIYLPGSLIQDALQGQNLSDCDIRMIVSLWDIEPSLLQVNSSAIVSSPEPLVHGMCNWDDGSSSTVSTTLSVNSIVISATLFSANCTLNTSDLSKPVQITLHHVNQSLDDPTCSFLDPEDNSGSEWVGGGCRVQESNSSEDSTVCECFHLTSFALLMSPTGTVSVSKSLLVATKVGLCVSILALVLTCFLLFILELESNLNKVHRQLALALCLSQIVFLVGVDRVSIPYPDAACTTIAALLHYLLLCTFAWELLEGVHLYLFIVKVFYNKKVMWFYYPIAWGIPLIIVAVTLGLNFCDYGSQNFCWITTGNGTNWAFHGPVILVIIVNIIVLVIITAVVIRSARRRDPDSCGFCKLLQASIILVPTLGLTWILGFLVVSDGTYATVMEWIFFICTTLQGIFIFTIHCVLNTEVRASFLKKLGFREAAKKQKSVFSMKPSFPTINSIGNAARRFSFGSIPGSRRGSLEPLSPENTGLQMFQEKMKHHQLLHLDPVNEDSQEDIADLDEMESKFGTKSDEAQPNGGFYPNDEGDMSVVDLITQEQVRPSDEAQPNGELHPNKEEDMSHKLFPDEQADTDSSVPSDTLRSSDNLFQDTSQSDIGIHTNKVESDNVIVNCESDQGTSNNSVEVFDQPNAALLLLVPCQETGEELVEEVQRGSSNGLVQSKEDQRSFDGLSSDSDNTFFTNKSLVSQEYKESSGDELHNQSNNKLLPDNEDRDQEVTPLASPMHRRKSSADNILQGMYKFGTDQDDILTTDGAKIPSDTELPGGPVPGILAEFPTTNEHVEMGKIKLVGFTSGVICNADDTTSVSSQPLVPIDQETNLEPVSIKDPTNIFLSNSVEDLLLQRAESSAALLEEELEAIGSSGDLLY